MTRCPICSKGCELNIQGDFDGDGSSKCPYATVTIISDSVLTLGTIKDEKLKYNRVCNIIFSVTIGVFITINYP